MNILYQIVKILFWLLNFNSYFNLSTFKCCIQVEYILICLKTKHKFNYFSHCGWILINHFEEKKKNTYLNLLLMPSKNVSLIILIYLEKFRSNFKLKTQKSIFYKLEYNLFLKLVFLKTHFDNVCHLSNTTNLTKIIYFSFQN